MVHQEITVYGIPPLDITNANCKYKVMGERFSPSFICSFHGPAGQRQLTLSVHNKTISRRIVNISHETCDPCRGRGPKQAMLPLDRQVNDAMTHRPLDFNLY